VWYIQCKSDITSAVSNKISAVMTLFNYALPMNTATTQFKGPVL
jgi:hypothetical protein